MKSSVEEIRSRFDGDVERFSDLDTGQVSTIDAKLSLELLTEAARRWVPQATHLLDIGCGAGNYSLQMLAKIPGLHCTLVDLSQPMLDRAHERVTAQGAASATILQGDIRTLPLPESSFDVILAGAVLHHLREEREWQAVFAKIFSLLKPGGCFMVSDLVTQDTPELTALMWQHYANYLEQTGGEAYRKKVLAYIEIEDSPRSLTYQLGLMHKAGFTQVEVLHKHLCFAAFGGRRYAE